MWLNDLQEGQGEEFWQDGSVYSGSFSKGQKEGFGKGVIRHLQMGRWKQLRGLLERQHDSGGRQVPMARRTQLRRRVADGEDARERTIWVEWYDFFHLNVDGRYYEGYYENDKKHGYGEYVWEKGKTYQGQWH